MDYQTLKNRLLEFRRQRDWEQFHDPKNLAEGLIIEAGELLENFLWKQPADCRHLTPTERKRVEEEIGDIFAFLIYLCCELNIDPFEAARRKIEINEQKYPVEKSKGKSTKYKDL
ncbi:MAG TPA: nucleotide pyrophosphohydrolase [Anaerohalosphaeraceae bacterium]|nr:nucleotide pyrophosphohydrolase [Anaerohalosphaeraceae bacterium]